MKEKTKRILDGLWEYRPELKICKSDIIAAWGFLYNCFKKKGKLLACGNGGSAADADHIVGELMNRLSRRRPVPAETARKLKEYFGSEGEHLAGILQCAMPAISLVSQAGLLTAIANDFSADLIFAQQVYGYGRKGDVLLAISTSGNSPNVLQAIRVAKALDMKVIGLTGGKGGKMKSMCDVAIVVPSTITPHTQELHQPLYHVLCDMLEEEFFGEEE